MSWITTTLTSSLGKKLVMALTGLFLVVFLLEHLIGNALLLKFDDGLAFNEYAHFMKEVMIIRIAEIGLFGGIFLHAIQGIILVKQQKEARPVGYATPNKSKVDHWASKFMGPFGYVILIFIFLHLYHFFSYKYDVTADLFGHHLIMDSHGTPDMAGLVYETFKNPFDVLIYVIAMIAVMFHMSHGFASSFQSLGVNHKKYTPFIKGLGQVISIVIPLGLAAIPVIIFIVGSK